MHDHAADFTIYRKAKPHGKFVPARKREDDSVYIRFGASHHDHLVRYLFLFSMNSMQSPLAIKCKTVETLAILDLQTSSARFETCRKTIPTQWTKSKQGARARTTTRRTTYVILFRLAPGQLDSNQLNPPTETIIAKRHH
jgi:hypothetical protein